VRFGSEVFRGAKAWKTQDMKASTDNYRLADHYWLTHLYVMLGCQCSECDFEPDLTWAFDAPVEGETDAAQRFVINAKSYLLREGWRMIENAPCCPKCSAQKID
jgi:hypothetical protein